MATIVIESLENNNMVVDRTPRIKWTFYDTNGGHTQTKYAISIVKDGVSHTPNSGDKKYNQDGIDYAEYSRSNYDGTYFYHDVTTPLVAGAYTLKVMSYDPLEPGLSFGTYGAWSAPATLQFTVAKYQENIVRFSRNNASDTYDFSKNWSGTNIDITNNPDRVKLSEISDTIYNSGSIILQNDSGYSGTIWDSITYAASIPSGANLLFYARASDNLADINNVSWSNSINSGDTLVYSNQINITGRYIQIKVEISSNTQKSVTPVINYLTANYTIPAVSGGVKTISIDDFTNITNSNVKLTYSSTTLDNNDYITILPDPAKSLSVYEGTGYIILKIVLDVPVDFMYLGYAGSTPDNSSLTFQFKAFSNIEDEPTISWSAAQTPTNNIVTIDNKDNVSILYIKVNYTSSTDTYDTPTIENIYVSFNNYLTPGVSYFYSFNYLLNSNLSKFLLTANDNIKDVKNCKIYYGISCSNSNDFSKYQIVSKNRLIDKISNADSQLKIGVKMVSGSPVYYPVLHELGFIVEDELKIQKYFND